MEGCFYGMAQDDLHVHIKTMYHYLIIIFDTILGN